MCKDIEILFLISITMVTVLVDLNSFHILHQCIRMYDFKFETTCDRKLTEGQTTNNEIGYCTFAV